MPLDITLASIRRSATAGACGGLVTTYLTRCDRILPSSSRSFRSENLLLQFTAAELAGATTAFWIADVGGTVLTSIQFAARIRFLRENGTRHLVIGVGPADGWSSQACAAASLRLSLSAMTLPHELATLVLAEQIYRVSTILQGHPYHLGH